MDPVLCCLPPRAFNRTKLLIFSERGSAALNGTFGSRLFYQCKLLHVIGLIADDNPIKKTGFFLISKTLIDLKMLFE